MRSLLVALALAALPLGCATHYISNTDVEETELNRSVIEFCEQYRRAVELRNVGTLLKFADGSYYEDGASVDTSDDHDFAGLKEFLEGQFKQAKAVRYEIRYRQVSAGRRNNSIFVDYTYTASYKVPSDTGEVWRREVADNRLELVRSGETFKIVAGM